MSASIAELRAFDLLRYHDVLRSLKRHKKSTFNSQLVFCENKKTTRGKKYFCPHPALERNR
jgi:hypothetical protein